VKKTCPKRGKDEYNHKLIYPHPEYSPFKDIYFPLFAHDLKEYIDAVKHLWQMKKLKDAEKLT
tara:strand:- start:1323 stop:1511 length:189 start_codon:yes stop_codon:yes gene_type:complete